MIIYHGSKDIIKTPKFGYGKKYNDYGLGFYCTSDISLAKEWSVDFNRSGYANVYELDTEGLKILELDREKCTILHWLAILLDNREFDIQSDFGLEAKQYILKHFDSNYQDYDVIYGYRADDSYFTFAQDFLNNQISLKTLENAMHLGNLGMQYALKSKKAFNQINYKGYQEALDQEWYPIKENRDLLARKRYSELRQQPWMRGEIYVMTILDEEMKADDVRLRS